MSTGSKSTATQRSSTTTLANDITTSFGIGSSDNVAVSIGNVGDNAMVDFQVNPSASQTRQLIEAIGGGAIQAFEAGAAATETAVASATGSLTPTSQTKLIALAIAAVVAVAWLFKR